MHALIEIVERAAAPDVRTIVPRRCDVVLDLVECLSHLDVELIHVLVYEDVDEDRCVGIWRWRVGKAYRHGNGTTWCDAHTDGQCLGWYLGRDGSIEPCDECWPGARVYDVQDLAHLWFLEQDAARHVPTDECPGCPGYDVFSRDDRGDVELQIQRCDDCGVYDGDREPVLRARQLYVAAGYHLIDGTDLPAEEWTP